MTVEMTQWNIRITTNFDNHALLFILSHNTIFNNFDVQSREKLYKNIHQKFLGSFHFGQSTWTFINKADTISIWGRMN